MEQITTLDTYFDTPQRNSQSELESKISKLSENQIVKQLLEGYPDLAVILDWNRQIIAYNSKVENILHNSEEGSIYGQRLGEALRCKHAFEMPAGCGTSMFCKECGAGKCNKLSRDKIINCSDQCRIITNVDGIESSLDLRVYSSILKLNGDVYTIFSIKNTANEKRKEVLERIFFHDVLNTATAIQGISGILPTLTDKNEFDEFASMLNNSSHQLIQEIRMQQDLTYAENGSLAVNPEKISVNTIISKVYDLYVDHKVATGKTLKKNYLSDDIIINTDSTLIVRSIGNVVKNALEAIKKRENVTVFAEEKNDLILFKINNDGVIPDDIQLQIFQRSFSTKADIGRGIGTYSVKLIVEQYLKGKVYFTSNQKEQTTFTIEIPKVFPS